MKNNFKIIIFITITIIALYFTKTNYSEYSKKKSISSCVIALKKKNEKIKIEEAKKFCENEINKNLKK